ncbi:MAG: sensor domain-containing diguanylate cyclase [Oscillospiraceae bacterium]|nr:sensor domain-containing diguanylate cyclase [Oscillospiraceae bacterium]
MENKHSSDAILDNFFAITQSLYKEMSKPDNDASDDHAEIYRLLTDLGRTLVDADRASFWKWDKRNHTLWTTAAVGEGRITIPEGTGLVGKALVEKRAIVTNDPYNCPDFNSSVDKKTGYVTNSILVMPISNCKGEFIGAYQAINKLSGEGFDIEEDVKRLSLAAFICGITLESDSFLEDSLHDKLTELKNRAGFYSDYTKVYEEILKDTSADRNVSLIICDIDFFKKVNDTYGHNAGDAVLRHVASMFRSNARPGDGIYRWGGEEFLVVLPDTNKEQAIDIAERLRTSVMESVCHFEDLSIKVTMSFGLTVLNMDNPIEENIKIADERLYKAKEGGRNRVISE